MLPLEYYSVSWLQRAGNEIGKTLKVDTITLLASRGCFARVCVDLDLRQPLKPAYHLKNRSWKLQYEGLQVMCDKYGRYGHGTSACPLSPSTSTAQAANQSSGPPPLTTSTNPMDGG